MKKIFETKFNAFSVMVIIICVAINFYGKLLVSIVDLPLYCDAIGTCIAAYLCGPVIGAICGAISNIIVGISQDIQSLLYCFTSIGLGIVVGILAKKDMQKNMIVAYTTGIFAAFTCIVISYPLNIIIYDGYVGNRYGDLIIDLFYDTGLSVYLSEFFGEFAIEVPDKMLSVFIAYFVYRFFNSRKWFREIYLSSPDMEDNDAKI